jgi:3',5'-cyclic AMP phosphodiesterase CpdA
MLACQKQLEPIENSKNGIAPQSLSNIKNNSGHIKLAVLSDIHYMHPSLNVNNGISGTEFQKMLDANPNKALLEYSVPIFESVLNAILIEKPDILLIAGDLTKDGEMVGAQAVAEKLKALKNAGIKIYLVPGNNDINNNSSFLYDGNAKIPVPNTSPAQYEEIFSDFGFASAISRDASSLSYVAEPFEGLRILAIDAAKYSPTYSRSGKIKPATMQWINQQMNEAKEQNITVLGMMHHNLIQHLTDQNKVMPGTVVDDWSANADMLISAGLKVIFTGHNHSNDITMRITNGDTLYDVETGSLVAAPSPYRIMILKNKELDIETRYVTNISAALPEGMDFVTYSKQAQLNLLSRFMGNILPSVYQVPADLLPVAIPLASNAYAAHMAGDEWLSPHEAAAIQSLSKLDTYGALSYTIKNLWTDLGIKDGKWHFKVVTK